MEEIASCKNNQQDHEINWCHLHVPDDNAALKLAVIIMVRFKHLKLILLKSFKINIK